MVIFQQLYSNRMLVSTRKYTMGIIPSELIRQPGYPGHDGRVSVLELDTLRAYYF